MKKILSVLVVIAAVTVVLVVTKIATAQWRGGYGPGMGRMGPGMMMGPGFGTGGTQITEEKAKELAQEYADKNLAGFKVERVFPSAGMHHTMYSVELKDAKGELRNIHVTPFGGVMSFSGPAGRN